MGRGTRLAQPHVPPTLGVQTVAQRNKTLGWKSSLELDCCVTLTNVPFSKPCTCSILISMTTNVQLEQKQLVGEGKGVTGISQGSLWSPPVL